MNAHFRFLLLSSLTIQAVSIAFGQLPTVHRYSTMAEALSALKQSQNDNSSAQAIVGMHGLPLETPAQLLTLYDFAASLESKATATNAKLYAYLANEICGTIDHVSDPLFDDALAAALGKEVASTPPHFYGEYSAQTDDQLVRFQMRKRRLNSLTRAIGRTKDRQALPILRRMLDNDGITRNAATAAIGQIGDPADLDDVIRRIKKDPKSEITVTSFGPAALDRIIQEIDDPTVSADAKGNLESSLRYIATPENKVKFLKLLGHPNDVVREQAARAVCKWAKPGDEDTIIKIAHSTDDMSRLISLGGMNSIWNEHFLSTITGMLLHDDSPSIRAAAADVLAQRKVVAAIPELRKALSDKDPYVREHAQDALTKIR